MILSQDIGQQSHYEHVIITAWLSNIFPMGRYHTKSIYQYVFSLTAWMMVIY